MAEILLYAPDREELPHLALIMKLAQLKFSVARSQNELFYCVNAFLLKLMSFHLLLFHYLPPVEDLWVVNLALPS